MESTTSITKSMPSPYTMLGLSMIPFKRRYGRRHGYAESISATSEELMAHLNAESSESEITTSDDDDEYEYDSDDSFICTTSMTSFGEFLEISKSITRNSFEEGLQVIPEVDGEARLVRIISWVAKGYRSRELDFDIGNAVGMSSVGSVEPGSTDDREPGRERLEQWIKLMEDMRRVRERQLEKEHRVEAGLKMKRSKPWKVLKSFVNRCFNEPVTPSPASPAEAERRETRRSCVSDDTKVKKGNKVFRARRRITNVFRKVDRPVESKIAVERFVVE